ncbi:MAG: 3-oxoacyl-[acyl-carrier-protein] reductase [bacterium]
MSLSGKTALVTGGARGIGRAIVEKLLDSGCKVVIADVLDEVGAQTVGELSARGELCYQHCDVTSAADATAAVERAVAEYGALDILVNNAGITRDTLLVRMKEEDWDLVLKINLKGSFLMTQAAAKVMMKARSGRIVNISSVVGVMGNAGQANYAASKAGVIGLTKASAKELASRGITVNAIAPGFIQSEMTAKLADAVKENYMSAIPAKRFGQPSEVAAVVAFLAGDDAGYITGPVLQVCGGLLM